jgi:hypothetical protein
MEHIVIIGNGIELHWHVTLEKKSNSEITIISSENKFFSRTALMYVLWDI